MKSESLGDVNDQKINDIHRVNQGARTLARLAIEAKKRGPGKCITLYSLITPESFELVVNSTKSLAYGKTEKALTLGKLIGNLLSFIVPIKIGTALRNKDEQKCKDAESFQILYNWLIWRELKLAFFPKNSLYLFWRLEQSEQGHLYVDIGTIDRRNY